jgi:hypothetical protein
MPVSYALGGDLAPRARELLTSRGTLSVDERTNVLIVRDTARLAQPGRAARALARHADAAGARSRRASSRLRARSPATSASSGAVTLVSVRATGNPTGLAFPSSIGVVGGATDNSDQQRGPLSDGPANPEPQLRRQPPGRPSAKATVAPSASRFGSVNGSFNLNVRSEAAELNNRRPHRVRAAHPHPRQPRGDDRPRDAHPVLAGQRAGRADGVSGGQAAAPRATARDRGRLGLDARPRHPRRARLQRAPASAATPRSARSEAETDLLVPDGRTAVIGGIYTRNTGRNVQSDPAASATSPSSARSSQRRQSRDRAQRDDDLLDPSHREPRRSPSADSPLPPCADLGALESPAADTSAPGLSLFSGPSAQRPQRGPPPRPVRSTTRWPTSTRLTHARCARSCQLDARPARIGWCFVIHRSPRGRRHPMSGSNYLKQKVFLFRLSASRHPLTTGCLTGSPFA